MEDVVALRVRSRLVMLPDGRWVETIASLAPTTSAPAVVCHACQHPAESHVPTPGACKEWGCSCEAYAVWEYNPETGERRAVFPEPA